MGVRGFSEVQCWLGKAVLFGKEIKNQREAQSTFLIPECFPYPTIRSTDQRLIGSNKFPKGLPVEMAYLLISHVHLSVCYFNQVIRLLLLREEVHCWRAR